MGGGGARVEPSAPRVQAQEAGNKCSCSAPPQEGQEGTLARTSEVTGPGVPWPGAWGSGGIKGKDVSKETSSVAEREVGTCRTAAGPARGRPGASPARGHRGKVLRGGPEGKVREGPGRGESVWRNNRRVTGQAQDLKGVSCVFYFTVFHSTSVLTQ